MIRDLYRILGSEHGRKLRWFLVFATISALMQGISILFLLPVADALDDGHYGDAGCWLAGLAAAVIVASVTHYLQAMQGFNVGLFLLRFMHRRVGDHLVALPLGWFGEDTVGEVSQLADKGTLHVAGAAAHLLTPIVYGVVCPATVVVGMLVLEPWLGITLVICAPVIYLAARWATRLLASAEARAHDADVVTNNRVLEYAQCQQVLRAFGRTGKPYAPLDDAIAGQRAAGARTMWASVTGMALNGLVIQLSFTALIVVGAALALGGHVGPIRLVALLGIAARFVQPLTEVAEFGGTMRTARAELQRMSTLLATPPMPEPATGSPVQSPGRLELDRVDFGYTPDRPVLREVSFTVPARTMTALVGPSGAGKTTVTRLIARFYDIDGGAVRVGGVDVRDQTTAELMGQLALVFQDVYLFDDTLRENIRFGREDATDEDVAAAARLAGVEEIVDRLPDGWDTRVGEGGSALSGGERQRISIARALVKNAPVVLLDEATAALDPENEEFVQQSLRELRSRATLLVIAHKLDTVIAADQIVVLGADGRVSDVGTHDELLARGGTYRDFWDERRRAVGWALTASPR